MLKYLIRVDGRDRRSGDARRDRGAARRRRDDAGRGSQQNWAGYVASGASGAFSKVSGSWVQPSADASAGDGDSAFWVGLGGDGQSDSLEQIGTEADVSQGQTSYSAWYELFRRRRSSSTSRSTPATTSPRASRRAARASPCRCRIQTTGQSYSNTLQMTNPDTSSAEWIAEAPSASDGQGDLQPLPLADFGTVNFTGASATAGGHTGTISDSSWTPRPYSSRVLRRRGAAFVAVGRRLLVLGLHRSGRCRLHLRRVR